jgi:hypothetical protein
LPHDLPRRPIVKFRSSYPSLRFGPIDPDAEHPRFIEFVPTKLSSDPADASCEGRYETNDQAEVEVLKRASESCDYITVQKRGE